MLLIWTIPTRPNESRFAWILMENAAVPAEPTPNFGQFFQKFPEFLFMFISNFYNWVKPSGGGQPGISRRRKQTCGIFIQIAFSIMFISCYYAVFIAPINYVFRENIWQTFFSIVHILTCARIYDIESKAFKYSP